MNGPKNNKEGKIQEFRAGELLRSNFLIADGFVNKRLEAKVGDRETQQLKGDTNCHVGTR